MLVDAGRCWSMLVDAGRCWPMLVDAGRGATDVSLYGLSKMLATISKSSSIYHLTLINTAKKFHP
ncbi:hypothetical protein BD408DRAFT_410842 [Parasitella parasitica]|nr:hypothetical protein BD408DRAFT_410842 [Parasitella parasitica]